MTSGEARTGVGVNCRYRRRCVAVFLFDGSYSTLLAPRARGIANVLLVATLANALPLCPQPSDTPHCHLATLTLHRVHPGDEGEYLLLVRSSGGASEGSVTLNVTVAEGYSRAPRVAGLGPLAVSALAALLGLGLG